MDADLNKRIATELKRRGRTAVAPTQLQLHRAPDPDLLRALADHWAPALNAEGRPRRFKSLGPKWRAVGVLFDDLADSRAAEAALRSPLQPGHRAG